MTPEINLKAKELIEMFKKNYTWGGDPGQREAVETDFGKRQAIICVDEIISLNVSDNQVLCEGRHC